MSINNQFLKLKLTAKPIDTSEKISDYSYGKIIRLKNADTFLTELYISNNDLREVPKEVLQFKFLEKLDLSFNKINELPPKLFTDSLKDLNMNSNALITLPSTIAKSKLTRLLLFKNCLKEFKREWIVHAHLLELDISENYIMELPPDLFLSLRSIKILRISGNPITFIPSSFNYLKQTLVEFQCSNCNLKRFPTIISFDNLELVDASANKLNQSIATSNVKWLYLNDNPIAILE